MAIARRQRMAAIGDNCIDIYLAIDQQAVGGNAVNVAVHWARMGLASEYLGAVGTDEGGSMVRHTLDALGVSTHGLRARAGKTGVTQIAITDTGDRMLAYEDFGVSGSYEPSDDDLASLAGCAWAHGVTLPRFRSITRRLLAYEVRMSYDFSTRHETEGLAGLEVAFYSLDHPDEAAAIELAMAARAGGARIAVIMRGAFGSVGLDDTSLVVVPAQLIEPIDTCGAGDAYIASFTAAYARNQPLRGCMSVATDAAAATCMYVGAWRQPLRPAGVHIS